MMPQQEADICLILEGTYPYVTGGVSSWVHDLIHSQPGLTFDIVAIIPLGSRTESRYTLPPNVRGVTDIVLQQVPSGDSPGRWIPERWLPGRSRGFAGALERFFGAVEGPLERLQRGGGLAELAEILGAMAPLRGRLGSLSLLDSEQALALEARLYQRTMPQASFLQHFWGWRALLGGLYSMLLPELPRARAYHTICTGYAGVLAARAHLETGRPCLLTEHGIYMNERRVEIAMANWLHDAGAGRLTLENAIGNVRDLWIGMFSGYARACYEASARIITLYEGNQPLQRADGADPARMTVIPNGIHLADVPAVKPREERRPTIALIGRVVPIKDIKTFIRACEQLREVVPALRAWILGPTDEDPEYDAQCRAMVRYLELEDTVQFMGRVKLNDYLPEIDVLVLTSISEAQPLVILEAGAWGIPTVATNVGSCEEMILGSAREQPALGPGGIVTPLADPAATASAIERLLTDRAFHTRCGRTIRARLGRYYNKATLDAAYSRLYRETIDLPDAPARPARGKVA
ncbi:MAG: GT4 family glycosyltransferase PelF [Bryobacteraceae bacterium]